MLYLYKEAFQNSIRALSSTEHTFSVLVIQDLSQIKLQALNSVYFNPHITNTAAVTTGYLNNGKNNTLG
jgi:hypothetical protein